MPFLEKFSFVDPRGQQLWRVIAGFFPVMADAANFAQKFEIDPLDLPLGPGVTSRQLWHVIIEKAAIKGTLRDMVTDALALNPRSPSAPFLKDLLADAPLIVVSPEPVDDYDPSITNDESLLFVDDLTMPAGQVPGLIATLQKLHALAPSVCLLRVSNVHGEFGGTGFRIGGELVLTNHHVLFPKGTKAATVHVDFGFDVDLAGAAVNGPSMVGDVATIEGDAGDDWAVVNVANIPAEIPTVSIATARTPNGGDRAYIVQHPDGQRKRLGYVRNLVTATTDDRVQYLTDTQPGSSGAPVFDDAGLLVALHHRGGTPTQKTGKAPLTKNQGVRIDRVVAGMKVKGVNI
ncbi:MAG: trypsin-like peptidase domain-containing protein [Kofleriaceae bacterium]